MNDNTTAHKAADYETEVQRTIPFHGEIQKHGDRRGPRGATPLRRRWLDTGAGPGEARRARSRERVADAEHWIADPSDAMRALAVARLGLPAERVLACGSARLARRSVRFDVDHRRAVSPLRRHGRARAGRRALPRAPRAGRRARRLRERARRDRSADSVLQRARWAAWQRGQGRDEATIERRTSRAKGRVLSRPRQPSTSVSSRDLGFETVELVWRAYGQAGFLAASS